MAPTTHRQIEPDSVEPRSDVVGCPTGPDFDDEPDERVLGQILGGGDIVGRRGEPAAQRASMDRVGGRHDRILGGVTQGLFGGPHG